MAACAFRCQRRSWRRWTHLWASRPQSILRTGRTRWARTARRWQSTLTGASSMADTDRQRCMVGLCHENSGLVGVWLACRVGAVCWCFQGKVGSWRHKEACALCGTKTADCYAGGHGMALKIMLLMQVIPEDAGPAEREQRRSRDAEDGVHQGRAAVCGARGACAGAHRWQLPERCFERGHASLHPGHGARCAVDSRLLYCIPVVCHMSACARPVVMT